MNVTTNQGISTISNRSTSSSTTSNSTSTAKSTLDMNGFIQLMVTQLQNQNPLEPVSDTEYYAQIAELGTVQGIDTMNKTLQVTQASSLLGKTVTAASSSNSTGTITGQVTKLTNDNGTYSLTIKDSNGVLSTVSMDSLQTVQN